MHQKIQHEPVILRRPQVEQRTGLSRSTLYQYGPACVRDSRALKEALATLTERGRARLEEAGRRRFVAVNTALLDG